MTSTVALCHILAEVAVVGYTLRAAEGAEVVVEPSPVLSKEPSLVAAAEAETLIEVAVEEEAVLSQVTVVVVVAHLASAETSTGM